MAERTVVLKNRLGLHARAAARFVDLAGRYRANVEIRRGDESVDGKSILGILTLAAPCGSELTIVTSGPDEEEALAALVGLVEDRFGEEA